MTSVISKSLLILVNLINYKTYFKAINYSKYKQSFALLIQYNFINRILLIFP